MPSEGGAGRRDAIVAAARDLLEREGPEGLSMRRVAEAVGIRAPSLYKHVPDKAALEAAITADGLAEFAAVMEHAAEAAGDDPLPALGRAYRAFARERPHLYRLMNGGPLPRERLPEGLEARAAGPLVRAVGGDADRARAAWAFAHGMTLLELDDRFPPGADLDAAWRTGLAALAGGSCSGTPVPTPRM